MFVFVCSEGSGESEHMLIAVAMNTEISCGGLF